MASNKPAGLTSTHHDVSPPDSSKSSLGPSYPAEKVFHDDILDAEDLSAPEFDNKADLKLLAKIDWRVMPVLCAMFTLAFLDKVNIANAATFNLDKDLKLKGTQYNNCVSIETCANRQKSFPVRRH